MRALFGENREVRFRTHFFPFTEPSIEPDVSCPICDMQGCRTCKFTGWIELGGAGMVDPQVFANVGIDPEEWTGFAFGCGIERAAQLRHGDLRDQAVLGERPARAEAVLMRVPLSWLGEYVALEMPVEDLAERLDMATAVVAAIERRGVPDEGGNLGLFRVGKVLEAGQAPERGPAPALLSSTWGRASRHQIVCGAWNFGAGRDRRGRAARRQAPRRPRARAPQAPR